MRRSLWDTRAPTPSASSEGRSEGKEPVGKLTGNRDSQDTILLSKCRDPFYGPWGIRLDSLKERRLFSFSNPFSLHTSWACPKSQWVGGPGKLSIALASICLRSSRRMSLRRPKTKINPAAHRPRRETLKESKTESMAGVASTKALGCFLPSPSSFILWTLAPCQPPPQVTPCNQLQPRLGGAPNSRESSSKHHRQRDSLVDSSQNLAEVKPRSGLQRNQAMGLPPWLGGGGRETEGNSGCNHQHNNARLFTQAPYMSQEFPLHYLV